jgi:DNA invertase Pin-like site-specific DNA recombinase
VPAGRFLVGHCYNAADGNPELALAVAVQAIQRGLWPGLPVPFPRAEPTRAQVRADALAARQQRRAQVRELYLAGMGAPPIARRLSVTLRTVQCDLERMSIPRRQTWARSRPEERAAREREAARLYALGRTLAEIAEATGVTQSTIWRDLDRCGIPRRPTTRPLPTHCPQGHPYDKANTYLAPPHGWRQCIACRNARRRGEAPEPVRRAA